MVELKKLEMPTKLLDASADDKKLDLQKQIGCISGIFRMFDRRHLLAGRSLSDRSHRKLPSGHALLNTGRREQTPCFSQILQEKHLSKSLNENQTVSLESSRASFSSSSSSFSSLEYSKLSHQEACSFDKAFFTERSPRSSPKQKNSDHVAKSIGFDLRSDISVAKSGAQSFVFHNAAEDPTQKDTRGFAIETSSTEEVKNHSVKQADSPMPLLFSKTRMPNDLNEAIRLLVELKEAPWKFRDHGARDASLYQASQRTPRLSCDEREFSRPSMDSRDTGKSVTKLRELPRLSLDSRQGSQMASKFVSRTSSALESFDKANTSPRINRASNLLQDPPSNQKRFPTVVVKLMGLVDEAPDLSSADQAITRKSCSSLHEPRDRNSTTRSKGARDAKGDPVQSRDSIVTKPKGHHSSLRHNSRIMTEAAPWKQRDRGHSPHKSRTGYQEAQMKQRTEAIIKEVEERLKGDQFQKQQKDLKALKQMVDAMRASRLAQTTRDKDHPHKGSNQNLGSPKISKRPAKAGGSPKAFDPPIVIMKPAKNVDISDASGHPVILLESLSTLPKLHTSNPGNRKTGSANMTADRVHSPRVRNIQGILPTDKQFIGRTTESNSSPRFRSNSAGESSGISTKTSTVLSPRLQQRKREAEKSSPATPDSMNKAQIHCNNRNPIESVSPRGKLRSKQSQAREKKDQDDEITCEKRVLSCVDDEISPGSYKNRSLALQSTVLQRRNQSSSSRASILNQKNSALNMNQRIPEKELASIAFEQPCPVSVLDASCYQGEFSPSPVKRSSNSVKDDAPCTSGQGCFRRSGLSDGQPLKWSDETNPKKLEGVENFVQLKVLNSTGEEPRTGDSITSKCNLDNPDHGYVLEILLATGFLSRQQAVPFQLHSSGHAINPDLYGVLEKPKHGWFSELEPIYRKADTEKKNRRKLVFDVVNEILSRQMESYDYRNRPDLLLLQTGRKLNGQQLLEEVCSEITRLEAENTRSASSGDDVDFMFGEEVLDRSEGWVDYGMEQSKVALQMERLIFKDLINEVVSDATEAGLQHKPSKLRMQPFAKRMN
ncbi:unnamed protein product [Musa acuminata subsp. malaccensis]|uniref:(wild Malaysian banana) hypothetical protein n=1 Tax=Musa acuminata subsp. malaccensis TaxID=214687 RepID=A0A804IPP3_MUSAM|nr:PREDICTED: protein LONGIFOLIA 1-like [Musa acuminata subsp. malaccensis]CAG1842161.1 unnamed protein product [Musa acuminata subsp. malaccensis]